MIIALCVFLCLDKLSCEAVLSAVLDSFLLILLLLSFCIRY